MRYTDDPANLILPTLATIRHIARREGLGELSEVELDFVWDLLAKTAGAPVREFDEFEAQAEATVYALEEAPAFIERNGITDISEEDIVERIERQFHWQQHQRYRVLVEVDLNQIPGYNKPTQAVRLLWLFRAVQRLWILFIIDIQFGASFIQMLTDAIDMVDGLSEEETEMLEAFVGGNESQEDAYMFGLELAVRGIQVPEMLRIARTLNELAGLQGRAKSTPDPNGNEAGLRPIQDLSELGKTTQGTFALPGWLRMYRAASGQLDVRDPRVRRAPKQLLIALLDGSGSMAADKYLGASRAAGVVMSCLRAVIDGHAELYMSFFDWRLREQEFHADSPESARELMRVVSDSAQYRGTSTNFSGPLMAAGKRAELIVAAKGLRDPEVVMVTDGEDAQVPGLDVLGGKKLHAIQVGKEERRELSALARESGGIGVYVGLRNWQ